VRSRPSGGSDRSTVETAAPCRRRPVARTPIAVGGPPPASATCATPARATCRPHQRSTRLSPTSPCHVHPSEASNKRVAVCTGRTIRSVNQLVDAHRDEVTREWFPSRHCGGPMGRRYGRAPVVASGPGRRILHVSNMYPLPVSGPLRGPSRTARRVVGLHRRNCHSRTAIDDQRTV
jgi:hypothetical protein